jgi:hypothetical protein
MSIPKGFSRVTRRNPCPVCGKSDWCLIAKDGTKAICPRVQSETPAGDAGFAHSLDGSPIAIRFEREERPVTIDAEAMHRAYQEAITDEEVFSLSSALGVPAASLIAMGVGRAVEWCEGTFSFPMRDADGRVTGIRLRNLDGHKWAVTGSKSGLFFDPELPHVGRVFVCEGPTSAAALWAMEFDPIGRPSNSSGTEILKTMLSRSKPDVVIVSEMDGKGACDVCQDNYCLKCHPGQVGADKAADALLGHVRTVKVIEPLTGKDVRDWFKSGGKREDVLAVVGNTPTWGLR